MPTFAMLAYLTDLKLSKCALYKRLRDLIRKCTAEKIVQFQVTKSLPTHEIDENIVSIIQPKPGFGIENREGKCVRTYWRVFGFSSC